MYVQYDINIIVILSEIFPSFTARTTHRFSSPNPNDRLSLSQSQFLLHFLCPPDASRACCSQHQPNVVQHGNSDHRTHTMQFPLLLSMLWPSPTYQPPLLTQ